MSTVITAPFTTFSKPTRDALDDVRNTVTATNIKSDGVKLLLIYPLLEGDFSVNAATTFLNALEPDWNSVSLLMADMQLVGWQSSRDKAGLAELSVNDYGRTLPDQEARSSVIQEAKFLRKLSDHAANIASRRAH